MVDGIWSSNGTWIVIAVRWAEGTLDLGLLFPGFWAMPGVTLFTVESQLGVRRFESMFRRAPEWAEQVAT